MANLQLAKVQLSGIRLHDPVFSYLLWHAHVPQTVVWEVVGEAAQLLQVRGEDMIQQQWWMRQVGSLMPYTQLLWLFLSSSLMWCMNLKRKSAFSEEPFKSNVQNCEFLLELYLAGLLQKDLSDFFQTDSSKHLKLKSPTWWFLHKIWNFFFISRKHRLPDVCITFQKFELWVKFHWAYESICCILYFLV